MSVTVQHRLLFCIREINTATERPARWPETQREHNTGRKSVGETGVFPTGVIARAPFIPAEKSERRRERGHQGKPAKRERERTGHVRLCNVPPAVLGFTARLYLATVTRSCDIIGSPITYTAFALTAKPASARASAISFALSGDMNKYQINVYQCKVADIADTLQKNYYALIII